ncbi:hypothetical protein TNCV_2737761 [Trichonephila clavipes]|nr:hypothetical protein TNCV_2737761 [Trichonephila clavipes]
MHHDIKTYTPSTMFFGLAATDIKTTVVEYNQFEETTLVKLSALRSKALLHSFLHLSAVLYGFFSSLVTWMLHHVIEVHKTTTTQAILFPFVDPEERPFQPSSSTHSAFLH